MVLMQVMKSINLIHPFGHSTLECVAMRAAAPIRGKAGLKREKVFRYARMALLGLALLVAVPEPNHATRGSVRLPFKTVKSLMLVTGKINERPVTLVFDTGANRTIVSDRCYGGERLGLAEAYRNESGAGVRGESIRKSVDLTIADHIWVGQRVSVMDLDALERDLGIEFDGLLGQDVLREFRSVRIDYDARVIELKN
jgi:hypothetical protein